MNCDHFSDITGMRCNPLGSAIEFVTPFTFADGDGIELFAQDHGGQIHFFDDGCTLFHLDGVGLQLGDNKRRWKALRGIAASYEVTLSDKGVFETICTADKASHGFSRMIATLIGVAAWEREQIGVNLDAELLVEEVAFYLRAWKPSSKLLERPTVKGFSGRTLTFDFDLDGQYIDAIPPHGFSTGSELRKLVDFTSSPEPIRREVMVIIDDRANPSVAKQETGIIGRVAQTWSMSSLVAASGVTLLSPSGEMQLPH